MRMFSSRGRRPSMHRRSSMAERRIRWSVVSLLLFVAFRRQVQLVSRVKIAASVVNGFHLPVSIPGIEQRHRGHGVHFFRPYGQAGQQVVCKGLSMNNGAMADTVPQRMKGGKKGINRKRKKGRGAVGGGSNKNACGGVQTWRIYGVEVHPDKLGPSGASRTMRKENVQPAERTYLTPPVLSSLLARLRICPDDDAAAAHAIVSEEDRPVVLPKELSDVRVVRCSVDARKKKRGRGENAEVGPRYTYVLDVEISSGAAKRLHLKHQPGRNELLLPPKVGAETAAKDDIGGDNCGGMPKPRVIIVGAGPAGLFCALTLVKAGITPIVIERGQPVESRGKDIGALIHRRSIKKESNFAFGEGGAGTWSDGKLTTRIGRNSGAVRSVLETLVKYGAPEKILVDGAPHLGTDNLVRLLRNMRVDLREKGGEILFGTKMTKLLQKDGIVTGVDVIYGGAIERGAGGAVKPDYFCDTDTEETFSADAIVLATGHSARDVYEDLNAAGVRLESKGFAVGFRVEHPQRIINEIQYGKEWGPTVVTGRGPTDSANMKQFDDVSGQTEHRNVEHTGRLPVASYRLSTDKAFDGVSNRGVYSFCMCPGGQIVPASTDPNEVVVNGMSFSKRDSLWANSALVVTVSPEDPVLDQYREEHGVLAGLAFQRDMERKASAMGGGHLAVPVQRLTDFVKGQLSASLPSSSYRLGVQSSACHELYPKPLYAALCDAIVNHFEKAMPGFLCDDGLLHGVETRTSSPVRVCRDPETMQAVGLEHLFPAGEGAGFAGGIVSAAVDGVVVAEAVIENLLCNSDVRDSSRQKEGRKRRSKSVGFDY